MAYDASGNDQNSQQQIAGSTPLSTGGAAPAAQQPQGDSAPSQGPATPATVQTGASVNQAASQGKAQSKAAPKASSGMFTNIQKYVQKNQPQAQQMAQAATQDFSKQAAEIRKAAEEKQTTQANIAGGAATAMETQLGQAQDIVTNIMQAPTQQEGQQQPLVTDEQVSQFQQYIQGPQIQRAQELNLSSEQNRAAALQNLARRSSTEQGRRDLMSQAFGDRGYSRGQSALDNLIMSGDPSSRASIQEQVMGQADALGGQLRGIQGASKDVLAKQALEEKKFRDTMSGIGTTEQSSIIDPINTRLLAEQTAREGLVGDMSDLQDFSQELAKISNRDYSYRGSGRSSEDVLSTITGDRALSDKALKYYGIDPNQYKDFTYWANKVGQSSGPMGFDIAEANALSKIEPIFDKLRAKGKIDTLQNTLADQGFNVQDIIAGSDLTRESMMTDDDIARYNALSKLMGKEDILMPETKSDYLGSEALQNILSKYRI